MENEALTLDDILNPAGVPARAAPSVRPDKVKVTGMEAGREAPSCRTRWVLDAVAGPKATIPKEEE